jgi:hypothetical protein
MYDVLDLEWELQHDMQILQCRRLSSFTPNFSCEFFLCGVGGHSSVGITSVDQHNLGGFSARVLILLNSHMKLCPS